MTGAHAVSVLLEDHLVTFTRAVGLLRRRNLPVRSIAVGPTTTPGLSRLTVMLQVDDAVADRAVKHLEKMIGVREVITFPAAEGVTRELALIKVRPPRERKDELLDVVRRHQGTVVDDSTEALVVEVSGAEPFVCSCLHDLARFEVLEVARTGTIALGTGYVDAERSSRHPERSEGSARVSADPSVASLPQDDGLKASTTPTTHT